MKKMSIWTWLGAIFPILFLFLMMSVFHMKTERAEFLGIICAMISAILIGKSTPQIVTMDLEKGAFSALNILIVIWPAVFLYEMMEFAGVFQSIKQMLQKKTQDELVMVLLICWLFSSFLQGITGFGVPVAVCAPILIALGVQPLWSVIITLLGHASSHSQKHRKYLRQNGLQAYYSLESISQEFYSLAGFMEKEKLFVTSFHFY